MNIPLAKQNISKSAVSFICMLHYKYWCDTEEEKAKIRQILIDNKDKQQELHFNYFNKRKTEIAENTYINKKESDDARNKQLMVIGKVDRWYIKLFNKLVNLFK